jgi:predicted HNH restriction endonuclease
MAAIRDVTDLRLAIRRAVVRSHSKSSNALHGNATKKIELVASCPDPPQDMLALLKDGFLEPVEDKGVMDSATFLEGRRVLQIHYRRERNQSLVRTAKSQFKERNGHLFCEVCDFDFSKAFGELGSDFIEAHHEDFLANRKNESETRITDLRMVCANCHRMLHRTGLNGQLVTIEQLRGMVI